MKWGAIRSEGPEHAVPMGSVNVELDKKRVNLVFEAHMLSSATPARTVYDQTRRVANRTPANDPVGLGFSDDDGAIKVMADDIYKTSTIGVMMTGMWVRRNRRYGYRADVGEHAVLTANGMVCYNDNYTQLFHDKSARRSIDTVNVGHVLGAKCCSSSYYSRKLDSTHIPFYCGFMANDNLDDTNHCGGLITRVGATYDKSFKDLPKEAALNLGSGLTVAARAGAPSAVTPMCEAAYWWRMLEKRPDIFARHDHEYRKRQYDLVSDRYFKNVLSDGAESEKYVSLAFNSLKQTPAATLVVRLYFIVITPAGGKGNVMEIPEGTQLMALLDTSSVSDVIVDTLTANINEFWGGILKSMQPMPLSEISPSKLFQLLDGRPDKLELMGSPFVKALVRSVYSGWCYDDPSKADDLFLNNPPVCLRGADHVGSRMAKTFEATKMKIRSLIGS
jgi:hypothetical protein